MRKCGGCAATRQYQKTRTQPFEGWELTARSAKDPNLCLEHWVRLITVCEVCVLLSVAVVVIVAHVVAIPQNCTPQRLRNHAKELVHEIVDRNGYGILRNKRCTKLH